MMFLAVVVPPAVTLVWLGLRLLEQDRSLAAQRALERRDAALQAAAYSLEQSLSDAQRWFVADTLPNGIVRFTLSKALSRRGHQASDWFVNRATDWAVLPTARRIVDRLPKRGGQISSGNFEVWALENVLPAIKAGRYRRRLPRVQPAPSATSRKEKAPHPPRRRVSSAENR